jgi:hypothetical protein
MNSILFFNQLILCKDLILRLDKKFSNLLKSIIYYMFFYLVWYIYKVMPVIYCSYFLDVEYNFLDLSLLSRC